jgi:DedD protein
MAGLSAQEELILLRKRARRRLVGAVVLVSIATAVLWKVVGRVPEQPMKPESVLVVGESSGTVSVAPGSEHPASASGTVHAAPALASAPAASRPAATVLPESLSTVAQPVKPLPAAVTHAPAAKGDASVSVHRRPAAEASAPHARRKPDAAPDAAPLARPHKKEKSADPAAILEGRADDTTRPAAAGDGKMMIQLAALTDPAKVSALHAKLDAAGVSARFTKVQTSKGEATRVRVGPFASRAEANTALMKLSRVGVSGIIVSLHTQ